MDIKNRINNLRRDTDTYKNISISIKDIDVAIVNYIKDIIKPVFTENNTTKTVPVHFATPEIWNAIRKQGFLRDQKTNQIMVPVIVLKNNGLNKNTNMPIDKLDGYITKVISTKYSPKNRYNVFNVHNNIKPAKEYFVVNIPDYVIINYQLEIWTGFINHMNPIIEKFVYAEGKYWGGDKYKFIVNYDSIENNVEISDGENRAVKCSINMSVKAYILPESFNNQNNTIKKLGPAKIIITAETEIKDISEIDKTSIPVTISEK